MWRFINYEDCNETNQDQQQSMLTSKSTSDIPPDQIAIEHILSVSPSFSQVESLLGKLCLSYGIPLSSLSSSTKPASTSTSASSNILFSSTDLSTSSPSSSSAAGAISGANTSYTYFSATTKSASSSSSTRVLPAHISSRDLPRREHESRLINSLVNSINDSVSVTQDIAPLTLPSTHETLEQQAQILRNVQETVDLLTIKSAALLGRATQLTIDESKVYAEAYDALKKLDKDRRKAIKLKELNDRYRKELEEDNTNYDDDTSKEQSL